MGCFLVPVTEAVVTTVVEIVVKAKEIKTEKLDNQLYKENMVEVKKVPFSAKIGWLNKMLWGGSALLAFEHLWHGEVIPVFPFLTAVKTGETADLLAEMGRNGVMMSVLVTSVWAGMVVLSNAVEKNAKDSPETEEGGI